MQGWNRCAICAIERQACFSCAEPPLLRKSRLSAPSCAAQPELSGKMQPPWCPMPENLAETSCFRFQCGFGFDFIEAVSGYGSLLLLSCKVAGTTRLLHLCRICTFFFFPRCRPLRHSHLKITKTEWNVFVSHRKQIENKIIFAWKVVVSWRWTSI